MVATGQEIVRKKKILQGQGKVREFHFESGKIYIFEKSQGKVKFKSTNLFTAVSVVFLYGQECELSMSR